MKELHLEASRNTPEIFLSPKTKTFFIRGNSAPEDVRSLYYPVIEWINGYAAKLRENNPFTAGDPLILSIDLAYFNSSSAKFLFDILLSLRDLHEKDGVPVAVRWYYEEEDIDILDAGQDMADLTGLTFEYIIKPR